MIATLPVRKSVSGSDWPSGATPCTLTRSRKNSSASAAFGIVDGDGAQIIADEGAAVLEDETPPQAEGHHVGRRCGNAVLVNHTIVIAVRRERLCSRQ